MLEQYERHFKGTRVMKREIIIVIILVTLLPLLTAAKNIQSNNIKKKSEKSRIVLKHYGVKDKWFGFDKLHHFYYSASLTGLSYMSLHYMLKYKGSRNSTRLLCGASVFSLGIMKELYDRTHSSTGFSCKDLTFDFIGVITGLGLFTFYER